MTETKKPRDLWAWVKNVVSGHVDLEPAHNDLADARAKRVESQRVASLAARDITQTLFAPPAVAAEQFNHGPEQIQRQQAEANLQYRAYNALIAHAAGRLGSLSPEDETILAHFGVAYDARTANDKRRAFIEKYRTPK